MSQIEDNERQVEYNKSVMVDELRGYVDADRYESPSELVEYLLNAKYIHKLSGRTKLDFRAEPYFKVTRDINIKSAKYDSSLSMSVYRGAFTILAIKSYPDFVRQLRELFYA